MTDTEHQPFTTYSAEPTSALWLLQLCTQLDAGSGTQVFFINMIRYAVKKGNANILPVKQ